MKLNEFIELLYLAKDSDTEYKKGGWGSHKGNLWYFDCICLIKAILWGWNKDINKKHGGAKYKSNGVPDYNETKFFNLCSNIRSDFKNIQIGEMVWMKGHVGVYVGDGKVIEATSAWNHDVLLSDISDNGTRSYNGKKLYKWKKHGFIPYVDYNDNYTYPGIFPTLPKRGYFKKGDKGKEVKYLQSLLNFLNNSKLDIDGIIGNKTIKEVHC